MKAYLSSLLRISEFSVKYDAQLRCYARWAHRRPAKVYSAEEFDAQQNPPPKYEHSIVDLQPSELKRYQEKNSKPINQNYFNKKNENQYVKEKANAKLKYMDKNTHGDNRNMNDQNRKSYKKSVPFDVTEIDAKTHFSDKNVRKENQNKTEPVKYANSEISDVTFDEQGNYVYNKMKDNDSRIGSLMLMVKSRKLRNKKTSVLLEGKRIIRDALDVGCTLQHLMFSRTSDLDYIKDLLPENGAKLYKMAYRDIQMWSNLTTSPGIMGIFQVPDLENTKMDNLGIPLTIICDNIREPGNLGAILRAAAAVGGSKIFLTKGCVDVWEPKVLRSASGAHFRLSIQHQLDWPQILETLEEGSAICLADNKVLTSSEKDSDSMKSFVELCSSIPLLPYFGVNFIGFPSVVLVIGGETMGLSEDAYRFALEHHGVRLNIPLSNNVESLNTGTALGIIAFEIKRQFLKVTT